MKIKENYSVSTKKLIPVFCVSAVLGIIIRLIQMIKYIDVETGFYTGGALLSWLLPIIIFVPTLFFAAVSFVSKDSVRVSLSNGKNKPLAVICAAFAIVVLWDCINQLFIFTESFANPVNPGLTPFRNLMISGTIPALMQSFFAFFTAIYIFFFAIDYGRGKKLASKRKLLAIMPIGWAISKLLFRFLKEISYIRISDLFFELIMVGFMILFFLSLAQVSSGVYSETMRWRITAFGLPSALIAVILNIPRLLLTHIGDGAHIVYDYPFYSSDLVYGFFAFAICLNIILSKEQTEESV